MIKRACSFCLDLPFFVPIIFEGVQLPLFVFHLVMVKLNFPNLFIVVVGVYSVSALPLLLSRTPPPLTPSYTYK